MDSMKHKEQKHGTDNLQALLSAPDDHLSDALQMKISFTTLKATRLDPILVQSAIVPIWDTSKMS